MNSNKPLEVNIMKKYMILLTGILALCIIMPSFTLAQDTKEKQVEKKKLKVSGDFLNTWKKVGNKTKEIRSFKTEKSVTVAGVRGAEAEDEAMKFLYYKGGIRYPSRLELKNSLEILVEFIRENPGDEAMVEIQYFVGLIYVQLEEVDKGIAAFNAVVENFPDSEYAVLAKEDIDKIKKQ